MNGAHKRQRVSLASDAGPGAPAGKPAGESEARGPSDGGVAWGRSESIDPDNVGDIADEGIGHRG